MMPNAVTHLGRQSAMSIGLTRQLVGLMRIFAGFAFLLALFAPEITHARDRGIGIAHDVKQIKALKATELPPGRHDFYLNAGTRAGGTPLLVPVIVVKGVSAGPTLLLTAAVHGDELNGIGVIHKLLQELSIEALSGTLVMVPGVNQPGMEAHSRFFQSADSGGTQTDLNRIMPGKSTKSTAAELFASYVWTNLFKPNADMVIDLHTQSRGTVYPLFVFADFRNAKAKQMATDLLPDVIKNDKGQTGTVETSFIRDGIPAVTLEIGAPKVFQKELIARSTSGIKNVMIRQGMLSGSVTKPLKAPFKGSHVTNVSARRGGIAHINVKLMDKVKKGQMIARVTDPFGREIDRYTAPHNGIVLALATDPLREPSSLLVRILK